MPKESQQLVLSLLKAALAISGDIGRIGAWNIHSIPLPLRHSTSPFRSSSDRYGICSAHRHIGVNDRGLEVLSEERNRTRVDGPRKLLVPEGTPDLTRSRAPSNREVVLDLIHECLEGPDLAIRIA
jgi:hypothetical protein